MKRDELDAQRAALCSGVISSQRPAHLCGMRWSSAGPAATAATPRVSAAWGGERPRLLAWEQQVRRGTGCLAQAAWQVGAAGPGESRQGRAAGGGRHGGSSTQLPCWPRVQCHSPYSWPQSVRRRTKQREHPTRADESIETYNQSTTRPHLGQPGAAGGCGSTQVAMQLLHQRCQQLFGGELHTCEREQGA